MTTQENTNMEPQQQQGPQVDPSIVIASLTRRVGEMSREIAERDAYMDQQQQTIQHLAQRLAEYEQEAGLHVVDGDDEAEDEGEPAEPPRPRKKTATSGKGKKR